jgi:hypothetical protein
MVGEYITKESNIFEIFITNIIFFVKHYIFNIKNNFSFDLIYFESYSIDSLPVILFSTAGFIYSLVKIKEKKFFYLIISFFLILLLIFSSDLNYSSVNLDSMSTINHYRVFPVIIFLIIFFSIGIFFIMNYFRKKIKNIFLILFILFFLLRILASQFDMIKNINNIDYYLINKNLSNNFIDDKKKFIRNQFFFYSISNKIKETVNINKGFNTSNINSGIIVIDKLTLPSPYRSSGFPSQNDPYYSRMLITLYLNDHNLNSRYLIKKDSLKKNFFMKIIDSFEADNLEKNTNNHKFNYNFMKTTRSIFYQIKKIDFLKNITDNLSENSIKKNSINLGNFLISNGINSKNNIFVISNDLEYYALSTKLKFNWVVKLNQNNNVKFINK